MYGKLKDGAIIYAPKNYVTSEGKMIFNFNTDIALMQEYGFKDVINIMPSYDVETQVIRHTGFVETDTTITYQYVVEGRVLTVDEQLEQQKNIALTYLADTLTDEQAVKVPLIFEEWQAGVDYKTGKRVVYEGVLYKLLSDHTSSATYPPDVTNYIYSKILNETIDGDIPEWQQPDYTNPYMKGDRVRFNGKIYESLIDNNSYSPTAYPAGWKEITE